MQNFTNTEAPLSTGWSGGKLHCRKDESPLLLRAPPLPGTCIFSSWDMGNHRERERCPKPNPGLFPYLSSLSALFILCTLSCSLYSLTVKRAEEIDYCGWS